MIRDPSRPATLQRVRKRANHWVTGICFILLASIRPGPLPSGLLFPLTRLFGGGTWTRILHPYRGRGDDACSSC